MGKLIDGLSTVLMKFRQNHCQHYYSLFNDLPLNPVLIVQTMD